MPHPESPMTHREFYPSATPIFDNGLRHELREPVHMEHVVMPQQPADDRPAYREYDQVGRQNSVQSAEAPAPKPERTIRKYGNLALPVEDQYGTVYEGDVDNLGKPFIRTGASSAIGLVPLEPRELEKHEQLKPFENEQFYRLTNKRKSDLYVLMSSNDDDENTFQVREVNEVIIEALTYAYAKKAEEEEEKRRKREAKRHKRLQKKLARSGSTITKEAENARKAWIEDSVTGENSGSDAAPIQRRANLSTEDNGNAWSQSALPKEPVTEVFQYSEAAAAEAEAYKENAEREIEAAKEDVPTQERPDAEPAAAPSADEDTSSENSGRSQRGKAGLPIASHSRFERIPGPIKRHPAISTLAALAVITSGSVMLANSGSDANEANFIKADVIEDVNTQPTSAEANGVVGVIDTWATGEDGSAVETPYKMLTTEMMNNPESYQEKDGLGVAVTEDTMLANWPEYVSKDTVEGNESAPAPDSFSAAATVDYRIESKDGEPVVEVKRKTVAVNLSQLNVVATPTLSEDALGFYPIAPKEFNQVPEGFTAESLNAYATAITDGSNTERIREEIAAGIVTQISNDETLRESTLDTVENKVKQTATESIQAKMGDDVTVEFTGELSTIELSPESIPSDDPNSVVVAADHVQFGEYKIVEAPAESEQKG